MSARRAERWLDLPPGAWQKRRLYALKVGKETFQSLGIHASDFLVVEPGARERPGQTVVTKGSTGLSLRRIPLPAPANQIPSVLELPLRPRPTRDGSRVVGTVIGIIRPTGTGALRPVRASTRPASGRLRRESLFVAAREAAEAQARPSQIAHDEAAAKLEVLLSDWRLFLARQPSSPRSQAWKRLEIRLATLLLCQAGVHDPKVRSALLEEAAVAANAISAEFQGARAEGNSRGRPH